MHLLAFSAERARFDLMPARLYGTAADGLRDRLLDHRAPVSGSYYLAPGLEALENVVGSPD